MRQTWTRKACKHLTHSMSFFCSCWEQTSGLLDTGSCLPVFPAFSEVLGIALEELPRDSASSSSNPCESALRLAQINLCEQPAVELRKNHNGVW